MDVKATLYLTQCCMPLVFVTHNAHSPTSLAPEWAARSQKRFTIATSSRLVVASSPSDRSNVLASQDDCAAGTCRCCPPCLLRLPAVCGRKRIHTQRAASTAATALCALCKRMVSLWLKLDAWWARCSCGACLRSVQEPSRTAARTQMTASAMSQGLGLLARHLVSPRATQAQITRTATTPAAIATTGSATSQIIADLGLTVLTVGTVAAGHGHRRHRRHHLQAADAARAATVATLPRPRPRPQHHLTAQVSRMLSSASPCTLAVV